MDSFPNKSGIIGTPVNPSAAVRMTDCAVDHGYLGRWTCPRIQGLRKIENREGDDHRLAGSRRLVRFEPFEPQNNSEKRLFYKYGKSCNSLFSYLAESRREIYFHTLYTWTLECAVPPNHYVATMTADQSLFRKLPHEQERSIENAIGATLIFRHLSPLRRGGNRTREFKKTSKIPNP
jgi:hypothetical protein